MVLRRWITTQHQNWQTADRPAGRAAPRPGLLRPGFVRLQRFDHLASFETRYQYSYRDRTTYRVAWSGYKWTRTGGWSWTRTSRTYVSSYGIVYTRG